MDNLNDNVGNVNPEPENLRTQTSYPGSSVATDAGAKGVKMDDSFYKHKRKYTIGAIIKSAVCGISSGLFIAGILLLIFKLTGIEFNAVYYGLIGVSAALLCGGLTFLIFRPTDKNAARRLDNEYDLNERVQTALAYKESEGAVIAIQREDAAERLKTLPRRRPSFAKLWQYAVIAVVSVAIVLTAAFIPAKVSESDTKEPPIEGDLPRTLTDWERESVKNLKSYIDWSSISDTMKTETKAELDNLLTTLESATKKDEFSTAVTATVEKVNEIISAGNNYNVVAENLKRVGSSDWSTVISMGGGAYRYEPLTDYNKHVADFFTNRYEYSSAKMHPKLEAINESLSISIEGGLLEELEKIAERIFNAVGNIEDTDGLAEIMRGVSSDFSSISVNQEGFDDGQIHEVIAEKLKLYEEKLATVLGMQAYHFAMDRFIANDLYRIFGYDSMIKQPENYQDTDSKDPGAEDPEKPPVDDGGGDGKGGTDFPGNDEVWDPIEQRYRPYGDVLDDYIRLYNEAKNEGTLTPEQQNMMETYIEILQHGFPEEK